MTTKPLLGPCDSYQLEPFAYEWAWALARAQENNNWAPEEKIGRASCRERVLLLV
jgi:ribonucleotide reductase beta subunit family protein with ferritin-like domain